MPGHRPASARRGRGRGPAAPGARHGCDDNTGTLAPASEPAASNWPAAGRPAAAMPGGYCREFPGNDRPAGHLGGQEHPFGEGRAPRPAGAPGARTTSPERIAGAGLCTARAWPWPWPGSYSRADGTSLLPVRAGSGRTDRRPGWPIPFRRWHRIRAGLEDREVASARPALGARTTPGGVGPGRQRAVPGTGSRPGLPWCRAGEGGACRAVNMAHTTFPVSLGVV